ncbi:Gx transporter family protein [candidate division KSB1 bacterium]|nr:Gx transporter family protein [candidate division KSB1 bacterium]MBL7092338.1 Gx transporter family protein [candidate division KSB1 bacterium]
MFSNSTFTRLSLLVGLGLILFVVETFIPRPLPWLKPGLAHVATLVALYGYGSRAALIVVVARIMLGAIVLGTLFNPAFILSFSGGITATLFMAFFKQYFSKVFSIFGISIIGAVIHTLTQLFLVALLIVQKIEIFYLMPVMILSSIFTGFVVAFVSYLIISKIEIISLNS